MGGDRSGILVEHRRDPAQKLSGRPRAGVLVTCLCEPKAAWQRLSGAWEIFALYLSPQLVEDIFSLYRGEDTLRTVE